VTAFVRVMAAGYHLCGLQVSAVAAWTRPAGRVLLRSRPVTEEAVAHQLLLQVLPHAAGHLTHRHWLVGARATEKHPLSPHLSACAQGGHHQRLLLPLLLHPDCCHLLSCCHCFLCCRQRRLLPTRLLQAGACMEPSSPTAAAAAAAAVSAGHCRLTPAECGLNTPV
jgi:hypothetical protein